MKRTVGFVVGLGALGLVFAAGCGKKEGDGGTSSAKGELWSCMRPEHGQCLQMQGDGAKADIMGMCKEAGTEPVKAPCTTLDAIGSCESKLGSVTQTSVTYKDSSVAKMVEDACAGMQGTFTKY